MSVIYVSDNSEAAINAALAQASAAGGGDVVLDGGEYPIDVGLVVPICDNIRIRGQGNTKLVARNATSNLLYAAGSVSGFLTLTANVAQWATQATITEANQFAVGGCIILQKMISVPTGNIYYGHIAEVTAINGNVISFEPMIPFSIALIESHWIRASVPISNFMLEGITFVGSANAAIAQRGVQTRFMRDAKFYDVLFRDFTGAAAFISDFSFGTRVAELTAVNCGSVSESDLFFRGQTMMLARGLFSRRASGFGPQLSQCTGVQASQIHSFGAFGRAVKFNACLYSTFSDLIGNECRDTGVAITLGTQFCTFNNLVACNNRGLVYNEEGIWFSGQMNQNNLLTNVVAYNNPTADIALFQTDDNNVIRPARFGTLYNLGANNVVSST